MVTISHFVKKIIKEKPFLEESLNKGIINIASLANEFKLEIENEMGASVKTSTIMMSIRRFSEKAQKIKNPMLYSNKKMDLIIRSNLCEVNIVNPVESYKKISEIYEKLNKTENNVLTVTQGLNEITLITNHRNLPILRKIFKNEINLREIINLSSITIQLSDNSPDQVGIYYELTKALAWENISVVEIVSTLTELTFILKDKDVSRAFKTLNGFH